MAILTQTTYSDALTECGAYEVVSHRTLVSELQGTDSYVLEILENTLNVQRQDAHWYGQFHIKCN